MKADQSITEDKLTDDQDDKVEPGDGFEPAIRISRQRMIKGKPEYLVLFKDGSQYWCNDVTQGLLDYFRMRQEKLRDKQRRRTQR